MGSEMCIRDSYGRVDLVRWNEEEKKLEDVEVILTTPNPIIIGFPSPVGVDLIAVYELEEVK